jgi:hypothetical protein
MNGIKRKRKEGKRER